MQAFDISNYTGVITDEQAKLMRDEARKVIVNVHDPEIAVQQIRVCRDHCMEWELYAQTYFSVPLSREMDKAYRIVEQVGSNDDVQLWMAFEDAVPPGISQDVVIGWIWRAISLAELNLFVADIYTRKSWWLEATGDTNEFAESTSLWVAQPDGIPDLLVYDGFGGWIAPTMKQYAMDVPFAGLNVDRNVYLS